jgi:hypothetical protein
MDAFECIETKLDIREFSPEDVPLNIFAVAAPNPA